MAVSGSSFAAVGVKLAAGAPIGEFGVAVTGMHVPDRWGDADRWVTLDFAAHSPVQSAATGILDPCFDARRNSMAELKPAADENEISRDRLAELLNEDLSREYQA